jgi:hypothetical protein
LARVADFQFVNERGDRLLCDAFGNNIAFDCTSCGHPILGKIQRKPRRRGLTVENPAICRHCGFRGWVTAEPEKQLLRLECVDQ